jgi:hypothetical protein
MNIHGIGIANFNSEGNIVPYLFKADGLPTEYKDSPIEIIPPFAGYEGFGGLQTRINSLIVPVPISNISPFGFKFVNNFIFGSDSYIGDIEGSYSSSVLRMFQFPNSQLQECIIYDSFNAQTYFKIDPINHIYGIGNNVFDSTSLDFGIVSDSLNNRVIMLNTQQVGFSIVPSKDDYRFGDLNNNYFIGLQNNSFLVGTPLVEETPEMKLPTSNWLRIEWQGQLYYVQLHQ